MSRHEMHTLRFDSMVDAAEFADKTPRCYGSAKQSGKRTSDNSWALGETLASTIEKTRSGHIWDYGIDKMSDAMEITDKLAAQSTLPIVKRDVVGGTVSVGAYLTGHPRCMRRKLPAPKVDKPVLSIGIPMGIVWSATAEQRINFGAAMLSAVDKLERNGYRCELIGLWRASDTNQDAYSNWVNIEYVLKRPQDRWNPATLAYVVAHPAVTRRLTWRISETQPQWRAAVNSGYLTNRNTDKFHNSMAGDFDIYFNNMMPDICRECGTPEGAFKYVAKIMNKQLTDAEEATH